MKTVLPPVEQATHNIRDGKEGIKPYLPFVYSTSMDLLVECIRQLRCYFFLGYGKTAASGIQHSHVM